MFSKILIANRGEIACRVIRTARRLGISCVAVYSDADRDAPHVELADEAWHIGPAHATESYLKGEVILEVATRAGAEAVHPGYGFLSENAAFAEACAARGVRFIGPPADAIRAMGLKDAAKKLMEEAGVPVVPGYHGEDQDPALLLEEARRIGFPVLIKAAAGGGGKGMRRVDDEAGFADALAGAIREAKNAFGDERVLVEKFLGRSRHVEVQVFCDTHGGAVYLFERDCSLQRRHQKVVEEAPAPGMTEEMRRVMGEAAVNAARAVGYEGAGTVEFIADVSEGLKPDRFYFMEMNTRLQVEHPVTEMITGQDLVEWQLRVAAGEALPLAQDALGIDGHAVEVRVYAEDAARGFLPATGTLTHYRVPPEAGGVRVDTGVRTGSVISSFYDPMIAKLIVHAPDRDGALQKLAWALERFEIGGCVTNVDFLKGLIAHDPFVAGDMDTATIDRDLDAIVKAAPADEHMLAFAALKAYGALEAARGADPWDCLAGWRLWGEAAQLVHLNDGDTRLEVAVVAEGEQRFEVYLPSGPVAVEVLDCRGTEATVAIGGRRRTASLVAGPGEIEVFLDGRALALTLPDALAGEDAEAEAAPVVKAPLPGLVLDLRVAAGDAVTKGQTLLVLEAMKMEHALAAPRDGTIRRVACASGEQVVEGAVLVELEDDAAA